MFCRNPALASVAVTARLRRPVDFERVLRTRSLAQSAHFAVHYLPGQPAVRAKVSPVTPEQELSTGDAPMLHKLGDNLNTAVPFGDVDRGLWLGMVVPKRHAKRSVTRSLMKRQIRAAMTATGSTLARGLWVVRLRAPFDRSGFPSAASTALQTAVRLELAQLLGRVAPRA